MSLQPAPFCFSHLYGKWGNGFETVALFFATTGSAAASQGELQNGSKASKGWQTTVRCG